MMKFTLELRIPIAWDTWLRQTIWDNVEIEIQKIIVQKNFIRMWNEYHPKWRDEVEGRKDLLDVLKITFSEIVFLHLSKWDFEADLQKWKPLDKQFSPGCKRTPRCPWWSWTVLVNMCKLHMLLKHFTTKSNFLCCQFSISSYLQK